MAAGYHRVPQDASAVPCEGFVSKQLREMREQVLIGLVRALIMGSLCAVLWFTAPYCCACVWIVMGASLLLMMFCSMHFLWIVLVASFVVTFWAGCQTGNAWIVVTTKI